MKILIADDEPIERMVAAKKIKNIFGDRLEILQAENGREAVSLYEKEHYDIALLDIQMPGINGLDAAKQIRDLKGKCEIIFLTAFDEFNYAKKAIQVKALDYLLKPIVDKELEATIEEAISILKVEEKEEHTDTEINSEHFDNSKLKAIKDKIDRYLESNYKEDISLQDISEYMNYSDAYFCQIFKQVYGQNFIIYLSEFRIKKAKLLLKDVSINVKDVSKEVGYRDSNYFAKVFKRVTGLTPSEYRLNNI